jgi:cytochrome c oxidase cbb3-type subunit 1
MCPCESLVKEIDPRPDATQSEPVQLGQIDASLRGPVALFFWKALGWLLLGTVLALVSAVKLLNPEFLAGHEFFTYGRFFAAAMDALVYGWGCQAVFAVALWLMARLCRTQVKHLGVLYVAWAFWNLAVLWGVACIFIDGPTGMPGLDMPPQVAPLMGFSYVMIAMWGVLSFHYRAPGPVYVSQWFLLAALLLFPWMAFTAELAIFYAPARGVVQSVVNAWYVNNLLWLWFAPVALAVVYYLLPKILGRPIFGYYLSLIVFWSLLFLGGWSGMHYLVYSPVPAWLQTVGIVGNVVLIIPVLVASLNLLVTSAQDSRGVWNSPVLRFAVFGAVAMAVAGFVGAWASMRSVAITVNLTQFTIGHTLNLFYAFFSMVMFAAMYYILPRVLNREWPSAILVKAHFWASALGITALVLALYVFGWQQGAQMNNPEVDYMDILKGGGFLNEVRLAAVALIAVGQLVFLVNFGWMAAGAACECGCNFLKQIGLYPVGWRLP